MTNPATIIAVVLAVWLVIGALLSAGFCPAAKHQNRGSK